MPKSLDDGVRVTKAEKRLKIAKKEKADGLLGGEEDNEGEKELGKGNEKEKAAVPTIRPGERMSDFAARVDAALPVSGLIGKTTRGGKDPVGLKVGRTKKEKKMHKLYDTWREEERKILEKRAEALELAEEEEIEEDDEGRVRWKADIEQENTAGGKKKNKMGKVKVKNKKVIGEVDDGDGDPWAKIKRDRGEAKVGFHDVVQAPPTFTKVPQQKFKLKGAISEVDGVPKSSGSLRRRVELGEVRRTVVEGYRAMMKENRVKVDSVI